ncbi:single-strand binding protein [Chthonomonas calidirosea]|uniref:Single-stranded DNA-binding protein n=1 Tax=Chthonomonas calidirosea (strain DSM 23976 / ICMP 18418 / T49) TaxID=1303518 RepID=S0EYS7_CHTCT|nr:single-stranded DNA-binding protein [Chthonomonas calidirosea]CCW35168.1 single-strand binding protein [Chthonomonas calidirosea T49]CEK20106.1 single-strand binding protein [Chthonomonas calidirosea]CEK20107.1 single-strand binding protein [Chthonomonas calidirosea]CEK20815.1 single-strand binding protein [Chthonomonas calidirosea]
MSVNRVVLVGRLTRDPEMRYTPSGVPVTQFGLAVNRFTRNEQGDYDVDFFNIVVWRKTAEFVSQYAKKGRLIAVDGRLQTRSWIDQTSGQKRSVVEIVGENVQLLDRRPDEADVQGAEPAEVPVSVVSTEAMADLPPTHEDVDPYEEDPFAEE